ncbi:MAG: phosphoribosylglycinamide formyltransferase [Desulfatibacillaceae bacterium]
MADKLRVGALISGGGTNLQAILDACGAGEIAADMVFVGTDNPNAAGLARARKHGVPDFVVDYPAMLRDFRKDPDSASPPEDFVLAEVMKKQNLFKEGSDPELVRRYLTARAMCEARLLAKMSRFDWDLLVLAGFMRILTPYFIDRVNTDPGLPRIMNIHPALLPAFPGTDGYGDTFRYGCMVGGCTVHFVDYGEDSGPIIGQRAFAIEPGDTLDNVKKKGLTLEWQLYPECIGLYAAGRLRVEDRVCDPPVMGQSRRKVVVQAP